MESSISLRSGPLREASSQEHQVYPVEVPEDELDHTGKKHAVGPVMRSKAYIFIIAEPQLGLTGLVSLLSLQLPGYC
jgi:hypothetical protein